MPCGASSQPRHNPEDESGSRVSAETRETLQEGTNHAARPDRWGRDDTLNCSMCCPVSTTHFLRVQGTGTVVLFYNRVQIMQPSQISGQEVILPGGGTKRPW